MKQNLLLLFLLFTLSNALAQGFPESPKPWQQEYNITLKNVVFSHPMTVVNQTEHAEILQRIQHKTEPQYSAFQKLLKEAELQLTFVPNPPANMNIMGGYEKNSNLSEMRTILWESCYAAYSIALAFSYTNDEKYAQKATGILMAWAKKGTVFTGADRGLQLGSYFNPMLYAADLLYDYKGWTKNDRQKFESWWRKNCLENGDVLGVMRRKDNNWKDAAILGTITAAVVFEDTVLLKEALIQQASYFYTRTDKNVKNPGEAWKFSKDEKGEYLLREVVRNDGRSGLTYTAYALTTMVQHFEIARYLGFDFWNRKAQNGASLEGIIKQYYKWDILNEGFPWHNSPRKTSVRRNVYELANSHFDMSDTFRNWLKNNRPVEGRQGDAFSTLNKGDLRALFD